MTGAARFVVHGAADVGTLPRVLDCFARRGLMPAAVTMRVRHGAMAMCIEHEGLDRDQAVLIAEAIDAMVLVADVELIAAGANERREPARRRRRAKREGARDNAGYGANR